MAKNAVDGVAIVLQFTVLRGLQETSGDVNFFGRVSEGASLSLNRRGHSSHGSP